MEGHLNLALMGRERREHPEELSPGPVCFLGFLHTPLGTRGQGERDSRAALGAEECGSVAHGSVESQSGVCGVLEAEFNFCERRAY